MYAETPAREAGGRTDERPVRSSRCGSPARPATVPPHLSARRERPAFGSDVGTRGAHAASPPRPSSGTAKTAWTRETLAELGRTWVPERDFQTHPATAVKRLVARRP